MALSVGAKAPDFTLPSTSGKTFTLSEDAAGKPLILYFYPRDFTPGCTTEACSFRDNIHIFRNMEIDVLGISTDPIERHVEFRQSHSLPYHLLSDVDGKVSKAYDARMPFVNISKRITYLLDGDRVIVAAYSSLLGAEKHIRQMIQEIKKGI